MNISKIILSTALVCTTLMGFADTKTVWRDAQGRVMGTATTDKYGKTTYRDSMGRTRGTSTTDKYGKTTYRDAQGRVQGTQK